MVALVAVLAFFVMREDDPRELFKRAPIDFEAELATQELAYQRNYDIRKRSTAVLDIVTFQPASLLIRDRVFSGENVTVRLNKQPVGNVLALIRTNEWFTVSQCYLTFTPQNWSVPQTLSVNSGPAIETTRNALSLVLTFVMDAPNDCDIHNKTQNLAITRQVRNPSRFVSTGDPHFQTFDVCSVSDDYFGILMELI